MRSTATIVVVLCGSVLVGSCVSGQRLAARDDALCQSYGAAPGTDAYVQCRMVQEAQRRQAVANGVQSVGRGMSCVGNSSGQSGAEAFANGFGCASGH